MTIRVSHQKNYTCITNVAIRDKRLSLKARGLHHLLLSYPDGWRVKIEHLVSESDKDGRTAIASALQELERCGYLVRQQKRDPKTGRLGEWETIICEYPEPMPESVIREPENGRSGERIYRNQKTCDIINTDLDQITKKEILREENEVEFLFFQNPSDCEIVKVLEPEPAPELSATLIEKPNFSHQTDNSTLGQIIPAPATLAKIQKYQKLDAEGIKLKSPELRDWGNLEIGEYVRTYRKSGHILTGGNDISGEFAIYVAKENCKPRQEPTIALGLNVINKCESDPRSWQKLVIWVAQWQHSIATNKEVNLAASITDQQEMQRISLASKKKFSL